MCNCYSSIIFDLFFLVSTFWDEIFVRLFMVDLIFLFLFFAAFCLAEEEKTEEPTETEPPTVDEDVGKSRDGSKTDDEAVQREEEAIKLDGLNVAQMKELREKAEKHTFQAEVSRMMKLIINSLYRNKEVGETWQHFLCWPFWTCYGVSKIWGKKTTGSRNSKKWMVDGWCLARILTYSQKLHLASSW